MLSVSGVKFAELFARWQTCPPRLPTSKTKDFFWFTAQLTVSRRLIEKFHLFYLFIYKRNYTFQLRSVGRVQESLANAKVSARQQCMYEGPERRNLRQIIARNVMLKSRPTFSGFQRRRWQYGSVLIRIAVVLLPPKFVKSLEIPRESNL